MNISRLDKLVHELSDGDALADARSLRTVDIDIVVEPGDSRKLAVMTSTALALAMRCFLGKIRLCLPKAVAASPGSPWRPGTLLDQLTEDAHLYCASSRVEIVVDGVPELRARLGVGCRVEGGVFADASGWLAAVNQTFAIGEPAIAPACVVAVCFATAKLFAREVLRDAAREDESWIFSLADFDHTSICSIPAPLADLDLGCLGLLGAGAIGNGFAYTLMHSGWRAQLDVIDCQRYDEPNQETSILLSVEEAIGRREKAIVLAELARRPGLQTQPIHTSEPVTACSPVLQHRRDAFVVAVDNPETRRELDQADATVLLNAGVGGTALDAGHLVITRHLPTDPPLSSRYRERHAAASDGSLRIPAEFRNDACSSIPYRDVSLAAPFMGVAAGALLAAHVAHRALSSWPGTNYLKLDLLALQSKLIRELKVRAA